MLDFLGGMRRRIVFRFFFFVLSVDIILPTFDFFSIKGLSSNVITVFGTINNNFNFFSIPHFSLNYYTYQF